MQDQKIWITGASSGIGRALAIEAARGGARILLSGRNAEALEATRQLCDQREHIQCLSCDLSDTDAIPGWFEQALSLLGGLDVIIANAGIGQWGTALDTDDAVEHRLFQVNFEANRRLLKLYARYSRANQRPGLFVGVGSIAAKFGQPQLAAYSASKAALTLYLESAWREFHSSDFAVQLVHPGMVQTDIMHHSLGPDGRTSVPEKAHRGMDPERFARRFFRALNSGGFEHYIGGTELLSVPLHALFPRLFYRLLGR